MWLIKYISFCFLKVKKYISLEKAAAVMVDRTVTGSVEFELNLHVVQLRSLVWADMYA